MHKLNPIAYILATFGACLGLAFAVAIRVDVWLAETGRRTISERFLNDGLHYKFFAFIICFVFMFTFSGLAGHLFDPIHYKTSLWMFALAGAIIGVVGGFFFGHHFFGQTVG